MAIVVADGAERPVDVRAIATPGRLFAAPGLSQNKIGWSEGVDADLMKQSWPAYLRLQAARCQQLSRSCMDLGTARNLRLMSEEYYRKASQLEANISNSETKWGHHES